MTRIIEDNPWSETNQIRNSCQDNRTLEDTRKLPSTENRLDSVNFYFSKNNEQLASRVSLKTRFLRNSSAFRATEPVSNEENTQDVQEEEKRCHPYIVQLNGDPDTGNELFRADC